VPWPRDGRLRDRAPLAHPGSQAPGVLMGRQRQRCSAGPCSNRGGRSRAVLRFAIWDVLGAFSRRRGRDGRISGKHRRTFRPGRTTQRPPVCALREGPGVMKWAPGAVDQDYIPPAFTAPYVRGGFAPPSGGLVIEGFRKALCSETETQRASRGRTVCCASYISRGPPKAAG